MTKRLRHHLPYNRGDFEYYDDSAVKMSQTPHYPSARHITGRGLEPIRRDDLNVAHLVHRQSDVPVAEFRQNDTSFLERRLANKTGGEIDHRDDRAAEIE